MGAGPSVVFLNRFYWPDVAATGQMLTDLAEGLAAEEWEVTVITSRSTYGGERRALPAEERHNGVRILRVGATRFGQSRLAGRTVDYLSYLAGALLLLFRVPRPDAIVPMSDPPLLVAPALLAGSLRGCATVYWLQDLYPHLAAKLGILPERGLAYRTFAAVARWLHHRCDGIIALGPYMASRVVEAGGRPDRTAFVHNWADEGAIRALPREDNPFVRAHGLAGRFVVLYSGNAGRAHTFDAVLEAARRLRDRPEVVFLFIGGGKSLPGLQAAVAREGLPNVRFLSYVPREELRYSLAAADVALVTENPEVAGLLVPSKTYGILASGRPLIFIGDPRSDVARVVREAECGAVVDPNGSDDLVATLCRMVSEPELVSALGLRARRAAEETYARSMAIRSWAELLQGYLRQRAARAA